MTIEQEQINALEELRKQLKKGKMSLLVGAGFSKNVSSKFPDWSELLNDMVFEMHNPEIKFRLNATGTISPKETRQNSKKVRQRIDEIIKQEGFLEIVSQYIARKGFRETIDAYIEEHVPIVVKDEKNGGYKLNYLHSKDQKRDLSLPVTCLDLHKKILKLKWNNIFTTNFDNCLECAYEDSKTIICEIQRKLAYLDSEERILKSGISKKEIIEQSSNEGLEKPIRQFLDIRLTKMKLIQIEEEMEELKTKLDEEKFNIVMHSSQLELQKVRNIIKLHGSLPINFENSNIEIFEFDNDFHKRYIISKEDYQEYPLKHEAFTQLMRISLLQDSFCLLGFSGIDPNFIAWIGWVRDIIERKSNRHNIQNEEENKYKIYLIDVDNNDLSLDKQIFFKNHRIVRISLQSPFVIDFLKNNNKIESQSQGNIQIPMLMDQLIKYLSQETDKISEKAIIQKYEETWNVISRLIYSEENNIDDLILNIDQLYESKPYYRIYSSEEYKQTNCKEVITNGGKIFQTLLSNNKIEYFYKLLYLSFKDSFCLIPDGYFKTGRYFDYFKPEIISSNLYQRFELIKLRGAILKNNPTEIELIFKKNFNSDFYDELNYEKALQLAFTFDFGKFVYSGQIDPSFRRN
jgi:hypothetical protein